MVSLKEIEFQFWESYTQFDDIEADDELDIENYGTIKHKTKRLNHKDMTLYGFRQNSFSVVTCQFCGMVLKPQALNGHIEKRHNRESLLNEENCSFETVSLHGEKSTDSLIEHQPKRQKLDYNHHPLKTIKHESFQVQSSSPLSLKTKNFFMSNSNLPPWQNVKTSQMKIPKLRLKLKKTDHGLWSVVTA